MNTVEKYKILCDLLHDLWADVEFNDYFQKMLPDVYNYLKIVGKEPFSLDNAFSDKELLILKKFHNNFYEIKKTLDK